MNVLLELGWMSAQATCLAFAVWVLRRLLQDRAPARLWCGAWSLVLLRLLVPLQPEHSWTVYEPVAEKARASVIAPLTEAVSIPAARSPSQIALPDEEQARAAEPSPLLPATVLWVFWLLGALLVFARFLGSVRTTRRLMRDARPLFDERAHRSLARIKALMKVRRSVTLQTSDRIRTPAAAGLWRWRIIIPRGLSLTDAEWDAVLAHELAHHLRGDLLARALFAIASIVHWPNPMVWMARRSMILDQELAADALAARSLGSGPAYGLRLLEALKRCCQPSTHSALAHVSGTGRSALKRRVRALSAGRPTVLKTALVTSALLVVACGTLSTPPPRLPALIADACHLDRVDVRGTETRSASGAKEAMEGGEPMPRYGAAAATYEGALYLAGGSSPAGFLGSVERFDPMTGRWSAFIDGLVKRRYHSAVVHDHHLYLMGGYDARRRRVATVERIDLRTGQVQHVAKLPRPRYFGAAVVHEGQIYFAGGVKKNERLAIVDRYDIANDRWHEAPQLSVGRDLRLALLDGEIYALGGYAGRDLPAVTQVERLDRAANRWVAATGMPRATTAYSAATLKGTIFTFGDYEEPSRVMRYNPDAELWTSIEANFTPRRHSAAATIGDRLYVFGGNTSSSRSWSNRLEVYELTCDRELSATR